LRLGKFCYIDDVNKCSNQEPKANTMDKHFKFTSSVIGLPLFFVLFCGLSFLEIRFGFDFDTNGILPRTASGLQGIILVHLYIQIVIYITTPLLALLAALQFYSKAVFYIIVFGILFSGLLTWIIGRKTTI
jgi:hypothetical protein